MPIFGMAIGELLAVLAPWITRFFMAKAVLMLAGFMGRLGLVLLTNEMLVQPAIDQIMNLWGAIPSDWQCWLSLFGATKIASIAVSAVTLSMGKRVFLGKSD